MTDQPEKGRRRGRGRADRDEVPSEELGWIADLRQAREEGGDLGPGTDESEPAPPSRPARRGLLGGRRSTGTDPAGADLPARDLPARDLPARERPGGDLPSRDLPSRDLPSRDLPARDLAGAGPAEPVTETGSRHERREARRAEPPLAEPRVAEPRDPFGAEPFGSPPRGTEAPRDPGRGESRWSAFRRSEPRRDEPRSAEPGEPPTEAFRDERRPAEPPREEPRRESTRERLGNRFASLRAMRGGGDRTPVVPAPATSPLPPEVLAPGRSVPPATQLPATERARPARDPDEPGRHESHGTPGRTLPPARPTDPGRSAPERAEPGRPEPGRPEPGRVEPGRPEPGRPEPGRAEPGRGMPPGPPGRAGDPGRMASPGRPVTPPGRLVPPRGPGRPSEPGWHDLTTGEKPPLAPPTGRPGTGRRDGPPGPGPRAQARSAGLAPPAPPGSGPRPAGGQRPGGPPPGGARPGGPPLGAPAGAPPTGPPTRRGTGEPAEPFPPRRGTGEHPPVRRPTGEHSPVHRDTGEQAVLDPPRRRGAELRRQASRAPVIGLVVAAFVLLIALPAAFLIHDTSADPVFVGLDNLHVPVWAAQSHQDTSDGSRWCVKDCRLRERTWRSVKPAQATDPAYQQALTEAGWRLHRTAGCPTPPTGVYTCWQRDEYVLDLWTRDAACDLSNVAPLPGNTVPPATDPSAPAVPAPTASAPPPTCDGSLVTAKVTERANPNWHP